MLIRREFLPVPIICTLLLAVLLAHAANEEPVRKGGGSRQPVQDSACNDVPAHPFDLILARPASNSVTVSVLAYQDTEGCIAWGTERGRLAQQTPGRLFRKDEPTGIVLGALRPDTQYFYAFRAGGTNGAEGAFHTQRAAGRAFTFTVTADSHLDSNTDPALYQRALGCALADAPDFHVDLGDTFMTEKHLNRANAARQYLAQRYYFGQLCRCAPLFLVLGNHDGESPRGRDSGADSLAVWANAMRERYFPAPVPDGFYTGDAARQPGAGLLEDYYAWEWGDALFVVLDPFWFSQPRRGQNDNWTRSLGADQYQWLARTLEGSRAAYKFVFIHHLVGGAGNQCRGGAEAAPFFEWGGRNADGSEGFAQNRPGWPAPIHRLLVQNRVSIVFHGHDHLYARQELDGVVYQEVPQPACPGDGRPPRSAAEYGYAKGTILGSPGYMRIRVSAESVRAELVRPAAGEQKGGGGPGGKVADAYQLPCRREVDAR